MLGTGGVDQSAKSNGRNSKFYKELTLKAPITNAADDIYKYFFIVFFRENKTWCFM